MQLYPVAHRQQLQRTLDAGLSRHYLQLLCESSAPGCAHRAGLLELLARESLPYGSLFHALSQTWLRAGRLSCDTVDFASAGDAPFMYLANSPDGNYLAGVAWKRGVGQGVRIHILRYGGCIVRPVAQFEGAWHPHPHPQGLMFAPDSRRLRLVDATGQLHAWRLDADGHWESVGHGPLWPEAGRHEVRAMAASPDGEYLVVEEGVVGVSVCGQTAAGAWQQYTCWRWRWQNEGETDRPAPHSVDIRFSQDGRAFLLANNLFACVCRREGRDWRWCALDKIEIAYRGATLAPNGLVLALFSSDRETSATERHVVAPGVLRLWSCAPEWERQRPEVPQEKQQEKQQEQQEQQDGGWVCWSGRYTRGAVRRDMAGFPMAFSPDSRQLVCPYGLSESDERLCVLSVNKRENCHVRDVLWFASAVACRSDLTPICSRPQFSVTGLYLAAVTQRGVQIWVCGPARHWLAAVWIDSDRMSMCRLAFSPDGYHCAASVGIGGKVTVWGPGPGGTYTCKLSLTLGVRVRWLRFAPDATRLVIVSNDTRLQAGVDVYGNELRCLRLAPDASGGARAGLPEPGEQGEPCATGGEPAPDSLHP